ncbi:hypothetical protein BH23GEM6_BH23GEM6_04380 [soil metagenome]
MAEHAAWQAALQRFADGYGAPFDPGDPSDFAPFLRLLEREVQERTNRRLVAAFRNATARLENAGERLDEEAP